MVFFFLTKNETAKLTAYGSLKKYVEYYWDHGIKVITVGLKSATTTYTKSLKPIFLKCTMQNQPFALAVLITQSPTSILWLEDAFPLETWKNSVL